MFSLLASTPIAQMLTRRDRPPASMPLKEESPADTGISDVPVFTDAHESTAKSTPASTLSNASQLAKPEGDDIVMALSAAGATIASVTILSDDMPATPFSLAAASRLCSPQLPGISELDKDATADRLATADVDPAVEPTHMSAATTPSTDELPGSSNDVTRPLATRPEPRPSTPVNMAGPAEAEAEVIVETEMMPEAYLEQEGPIVVEEAAAERTGSVESQDCTIASVIEAADISANETPARQSRRSSFRRASSAADSQPQPPSATETSLSPAHRPLRAAKTAASPASKPSPSAAAKPKTSKAKANLQSPVERRATRLSGTAASLFQNPGSASSLGKRGRRLEAKKASLPRELRRLEDTKEFSHVDEKPVVYTVWSNGKYVPANAAGEPLVDRRATDKAANPGNKAAASLDDDANGDSPRKRAKLGRLGPGALGTEEDDDQQGFFRPTPRRVKKWLDRGLYAGQPVPSDPSVGLTANEKKALATLPELTKNHLKNETLPMPIFTGMRLLVHGRDFKMPFDVFNPLPPGQPKPVKYGRFSKNRFVGDAHAIWRKNPDFDDFSSKCVCKPETGCDEDCQNRIMLYECDDMNCNVGAERCRNREFQRLAERTASKNPYHVGVEVFKTSDRGHGIRASRSFKPSQIIMEYIGEIITEEESDRRMNELYKNNACYYLMSFDQSLIIDGTSGSIARFVNHSCSPNCRMIKWIVSGQPRIALFAGDRPIMTGEELTYDYNFDPYSLKNVQTCLCGSENCRGILGPRKRDKAATKAAAEKAAAEKAALALLKIKGGKGKNAKKAGTLLGKRKLDAYNNGKEEESTSGPATKKANVVVPFKRGPGRPRTPDSGKKTKSAAKVTTTKAALAALAAKAARDARAAKATKAAKAAKAARLAKADEPSSPIEVAKAGSVVKTVKTVKAAKGVKVTKTARGLKAAKTTKTKTVTTTKTTTKKTTAAALTSAKPVDGAVARKRKATDAAKGGKAGPGRKAKGTNAEEDVADAASEAADAETALRATPMARALAKAAKAKATKATKTGKTAETVGKIKPKSTAAKRATTMAAAATKRAGKAKMTAKAAKTTTAKVGRPRGKAKATEKTSGKLPLNETADETGTIEAAKEEGPSKLIQQKLNFPMIEASPRRKPGRPPSAKTLKAKSMGAGTSTAKPRIGAASGPVTGKRPVGRPRGSKKVVRQQHVLLPALPSLQTSPNGKETEQGEKVGTAGREITQEVSDVAQRTAEDVIHVASSVFSAAA